VSLTATASFLTLSSRAWKDHLAYGFFVVRSNLSLHIATSLRGDSFSGSLVQPRQAKEIKKIPVLEYCWGRNQW